ncbi:MAG: CDGSH iron-sulfur domain-containing protein [Actinobacteria bacterium]|nr:CDGSH iron-sulfur domain-containing protein [Actinomycetota bacterium]
MSEKVTIKVRPNGSIRVTGTADFVDESGTVLRTETNFSLCRCGHSQNMPFCDSSHKTNNFEAPAFSGENQLEGA